MKLSLNWLKRYIDTDLDPNKISEILTDIGLEVEGMEEVESIKGGLKGIVVGEILTCEKHSNADKLSVTTVDYGHGEPSQIVCGAPNVKVGQKVLIATPGTILYDKDGGSFKIKSGKIRGEVSDGMICAEDELGLGESHDGIMVLPNDVAIGTLANKYFDVENDIVYDIGLTPNRSDATNHKGSAKDLAAYLKINIDQDLQIKPSLNALVTYPNTKGVEVEIQDNIGCPRYSGVLLENIKVGESPKWIKDLLTSIGVRPINNVVDITNFILHDLGQPLHAFDAEKISGNKIIVTCLPEGSKFMSLDEKERSLLASDLMICDGESNPMCIAGVFGGLNSGVTNSTTSIFLESAHFNAKSIRRSSTKHNLRTDAAKVYEKGHDPNITVEALERAVELLLEYAGANVASSLVDIYPEKIQNVEVMLSVAHANTVMGTSLKMDEIIAILTALEIGTKKVDTDKIICSIPTNKSEVLREVDVIEEILRIYGFNKVAIPSTIKSTLQFVDYPTKRQVKERVADYLAHNGFNEMMGLSLIESHKYEDHPTVTKEEMVFINNTSNIHLNIMRPDMVLSGLESVRRNINHKQPDLKLFEFGKSYHKGGDDFVEKEYLTLFMSGRRSEESWQHADKGQIDFFSIKKAVTSILSLFGLEKYQIDTLEKAGLWSMGMTYFQGKRSIVEFGLLSKKIIKGAGISNDVYFAQFNWQNVFDAIKNNSIQVSEISKYPSIRRDLAFVVDKKVSFNEIDKISRKAGKQTLKEITLFDVYENEKHVGKGKKSYAVKYIFSDLQKTLKDKEVDAIMEQIIRKSESDLGAIIRK